MTRNQQLEEQQREMEDRYNSATSDMTRITEDYLKQKTVLQETDSVLDGLRRDNDRLRIQVHTPCCYKLPAVINSAEYWFVLNPQIIANPLIAGK